MGAVKTIYTILADWGIEPFEATEDDIWEAIAELDGHKLDYYADGDLTEWL